MTEELTDWEVFPKIQLLSPVDLSLERGVHQAPPHSRLLLVSVFLVWQAQLGSGSPAAGPSLGLGKLCP